MYQQNNAQGLKFLAGRYTTWTIYLKENNGSSKMHGKRNGEARGSVNHISASAVFGRQAWSKTTHTKEIL
jgi:hypothetical protein